MIKLLIAFTLIGALSAGALGGIGFQPVVEAQPRSEAVVSSNDRQDACPTNQTLIFTTSVGATTFATTFATIDITIDPVGKPLGAYQFELSSPDASFKVLGVEAGGHPAFDHGRPPYFDPVVREAGADRLILAEYAQPQLDAEELPSEPVLIAKVAVLFDRPIDADELPAIELTLTTAGDADGNKIQANLSHTLQIPERSE